MISVYLNTTSDAYYQDELGSSNCFSREFRNFMGNVSLRPRKLFKLRQSWYQLVDIPGLRLTLLA